MFPKNDLVRKVIESTYQDVCNIVEYQKIRDIDGSTKFQEVTVLTDIPCRISFRTQNPTDETESASGAKKEIELFISPDLKINAGSKIIVTHLNETINYKSAGVPSTYTTHQQIILELFKGWA